MISDSDMETAKMRFPYNTPTTKEGCYFRTIFHSHFPNNNYGNGIEATVPGTISARSRSDLRAISARSRHHHHRRAVGRVLDCKGDRVGRLVRRRRASGAQ